MNKEKRNEYMRRYIAEHREKIRAQKRASYWRRKGRVRPETRVCATCGRELPADVFVGTNGRISTILDCPDCRSVNKKAANRREYMRRYMRNYHRKEE